MGYSKRWNVVAPIPIRGGAETYWQRLGTGFTDSEKGHISIEFTALPVPNRDGKVRVMLFDADKDNQQQNQRQQGVQDGRSLKEVLDDDIPF
jgi:hypothetical protein